MALFASNGRAITRQRTALGRTSRPSVPAGPPAPPQLQQVVGPADQLPLAPAVRQATALEPGDPPACLGLTCTLRDFSYSDSREPRGNEGSGAIMAVSGVT